MGRVHSSTLGHLPPHPPYEKHLGTTAREQKTRGWGSNSGRTQTGGWESNNGTSYPTRPRAPRSMGHGHKPAPPLERNCASRRQNSFGNGRGKKMGARNIGPACVPPPSGHYFWTLKKCARGGGDLGGRDTTHHGSKSDTTQRDRPIMLALFRDPFPLK